MTIEQAKQSIGLPFIITGLGLSRFDTIRTVADDGTIEGEFYFASCEHCRLKQEQPEHLKKNIDLFEHPELIPAEIAEIMNRYANEAGGELTYQQCADMLKECEANGYTFDYYLDAEPYNLRPITKSTTFNNSQLQLL